MAVFALGAQARVAIRHLRRPGPAAEGPRTGSFTAELPGAPASGSRLVLVGVAGQHVHLVVDLRAPR